MELTYTWKITGIKKNADNKLVQTYWEKIGTDEHGHEGKFAGATPVDPAVADINCDDRLTEEEVLAYIKTIVVNDYEEHVNARILDDINKQHIVDADMPWAPAEVAEVPAEEA